MADPGAAPSHLTADNLAAYLRELGVAPVDAAISVRPLAGGVSNTVLLAEWEQDGVVVKQALERLRVQAEWRFDRRRAFVERDCLGLLDRLVPGAAPQVVFSDPQRFAFGMTVAPPGGVVWVDRLRGGCRDSHTTRAAAELLGHLQARTADEPGTARRFEDLMPLEQGRVDPFHRTVARARPELAPAIAREVDRLLSCRRVLVHGDFSPKNVIAYPDRVLLLDCEVAHWGDPAFDAAFALCHLLLDGSCPGRPHVRAAADTAAFWRAYGAAGGQAHDERAVVAELGCLLLARVYGKSPLPTLRSTAQRQAVARYGTRLLCDAALGDVLAAVALAPDHLDLPEDP